MPLARQLADRPGVSLTTPGLRDTRRSPKPTTPPRVHLVRNRSPVVSVARSRARAIEMILPMPSFADVARSLGGVARTHELAPTPALKRALQRSAARGEVRRLRRGVYAARDVHPDIAAAAAVGGRVAGISALPFHGLWIPPGTATVLHVEVGDEMEAREGAHADRLVVTHWVASGARPRFGVAPLDDALRRAAGELALPEAVAVLDSALRATPLTPVGLRFLSHGWPPRARRAAALAHERSESGTESVLRALLHEVGIRATPQAPLPTGDNHRADLLIGDRLLIECDSDAHHAEPADRRRDLLRDESLVALGYLVVRFDYRQVFSDPAGVVATVAAIVARGDHVSRRPGR